MIKWIKNCTWYYLRQVFLHFMGNHTSSRIHKLSVLGVIVSLGIIYGDIGTSPLYVLKAILSEVGTPTPEVILGALSCIIWTLTLQTTIKYVLITLRADNKGEGGIFSLFALLRRKRSWLYIFAIIGGSTLLADGIITPSITVLSAVEGLQMINPDLSVLTIAFAILTFLFFIQQFGTNFIGKSFGPIMFIWFSMLGVLGFTQLIQAPFVIKAFNPYYAYNLLSHYPKGFLLLGAVFLCTTGAEALYTDLGHCGIKNIRTSWVFVKTMLITTYLGQGAWVINHLNELKPGVNPFYEVMPQWFLPIGIAIATIAAVIASQALISGSYTLITEAISLNFWPKIRIKYPSHAKGQMYVPAINWLLYISCIIVIFLFKNSSAMEAAYGLSITITMLMTSILMIFYLLLRKKSIWVVLIFGASYFTIEGAFLLSNMNKFSHGGWFTIMVAALLSIIMLVLYQGRRIRNRFITFDKIEKYLPVIADVGKDATIPKYASNLVYTTHADYKTDIEAKTIQSIFNRQPKRADMYWFLHVDILDSPYTLEYKVTELVPKQAMRIDFYIGFKMQPRINDYFKQVLNHLGEAGVVDLISPHPSLRKHEIRSDFRIVQIDRRVSRQVDLPFIEKITLNLYYFFKRFGISDVTAWGLDGSIVTIERIPLTIPSKSRIPEIIPR
jgi:KUP system potassium uptake protein